MAVDALGSISAGPLSLTIGETFTDNIASTSDVDYFKISSSDISVPSTATVTFTGLSSTTNNNEFVVTIRDSSDAVLNTLTTGISGTVSAAVGSSQPYYIRVEDGSTFDNSNYGIKVDITPTSESELASSSIDNGSVASSNHLIDNVSFIGKLQSATDSDWYAFTTGNVDGSTVTISVAPTASDATFYNIKVTDENGTTITKTGGTSLSTTAGSSAGSLTFDVVSSSSTPAGTYFLNVAASDTSTFASSSEFGNNYTITLAGTTDYNATPVTSIGSVSSGAYGTMTENDNLYANVSRGSTTALSNIISVSDADTDSINASIGTYYIGLEDTTTSSVETAGTITYTDDDTSATTIIAAQTSTGSGFFNALSATEFASANYVAGSSSGGDNQKIYAFALDTSGSSASSLGLTYPFDTSGIVKYRYITSDASVTISGSDSTVLYEGNSSTSQTLTASLEGTPSNSNDVKLIIDAPVDLTLSGDAVTQVSASENTYRLTLDASTTSAEFTVSAPVIADSDGVTETATLTYSTVSSDSNFDGLTISNTDFTVSENIATFVVSEVTYSAGSNLVEGDTGRTATYTITASGIGSSETLTLNVSGSGLTFTSAASFDLTTSSNVATIVVNADDDSSVEAGSGNDGIHSHAITHAIYEGSTVAANYVGVIDNKSIAVQDNDSAPALSVSDVTTSNENAASATLTVSASAPYSSAVTVDYATSNGTSTAGSDYTAATGTLTFAAGETSKTIDVPVLSDTTDENNETAIITLSNPSNATISDATGTLTITDDDDAPSLSINDITGSDGSANNASFTVSLAAASGKEITVDYATSNGTAVAGSDYTATSGTLTFAAGETSKTLTVPILTDSLDEGDETVVMTLSNASNASITDAAGTLTISGGIVIAVHDSDGSTSAAIPDVTLNLFDSSSNSTSFTSSDGDITLTSDLTISHVTVTDSSSHQYSSGIALDDVMSSLRAYVGMTTLTGQAFHAADVDNNGSLELSDVMSSLRAYVGMTSIDTFDLIDASGTRVTDVGSSSDSTLFLVENGDVSLDGSFVDIT